MRILFLSPNQRTRWNPGHQLFRDAIGRQHKVVYVGPGYGSNESGPPYNVPKIMSAHRQFDLVMTYGLRYTWQFHGLSEVRIPKVHFVCDFLPNIHGTGYGGTLRQYWELLRRDKYDFFFCLSYQARRLLMHGGVPLKDIGLLPFGVDPDIYKASDMPMEKRAWDVNASYSQHAAAYPNRRAVTDVLDYMNKVKAIKAFTGRVFGGDYIQKIRSARIGVVSINHWHIVNMRVFEVMSCGAVLFTDSFEEMKLLGLQDGRHLVLYKGVDDLKRQIMNYIDAPGTLQALASEARKEVKRCHSNDHRVKQMTETLDQWMSQ